MHHLLYGINFIVVKEEEEKKRKEEQERLEHEEYLKLKESFAVEGEGSGEQELQEEVLQYIITCLYFIFLIRYDCFDLFFVSHCLCISIFFFICKDS